MGNMIICHECCDEQYEVELVDGTDVYPHRKDLTRKLFWQCSNCKSFVGCHPNTTKALGPIVNQEVKSYRRQIHAVLDPIWQYGTMTRSRVYTLLSRLLGYTYHTGEILSIEEAKYVLELIDKYIPTTLTPIEGDFE